MNADKNGLICIDLILCKFSLANAKHLILMLKNLNYVIFLRLSAFICVYRRLIKNASQT